MNDKKIVSKKNSDYFFTEVYIHRIVESILQIALCVVL